MITVEQVPNQLNLANTNLVYTLSSDSSSRSQFQYICLIQDSGSNLLTTIKQQPNPNNKGVFDLGRIVRQYLYFDTYAPLAGNSSTNALFNKQTETAKSFKIRFGEEWGTSPTSSVTVSPITTTGSVSYNYWVDGTWDPNLGSYNWYTSSYYKPQTTPSSATFNYNVALTDANRTQSCQIGDYMSVSLLNGNLDGSTTVAQDIYSYKIDVFSNGTNVYSDYVVNIAATSSYEQGGPRVLASQLWSTVAAVPTGSNVVNKQTQETLLIHVGIGPQNITDQGVYYDFTTQPWDYYTITFLSQDSPNTSNNNGVWDKFTIVKQQSNCGYDTKRLMWINNLGVWDYYNFTLASTNTYELEKSTYKKNFVDYSTDTTATYDIRRRGTSVFDTQIRQVETVNSNWLTQEEADWLEQMFYSPNVYIQEGRSIIPIWIDTTDVITKSNPRSQKLFTYNVSYRKSNQKRSR